MAELDGLALLMDAVTAGLGATIRSGAGASRLASGQLALVPLADAHARRPNLLVSLCDDELPPAALATRVVLADVARQRVADGSWMGASFHET